MENENYPKAKKQQTNWMCGTHEVKDDYLYMTNAKNPDVLAWTAKENAYTDQWFQDKKLEEKISFLQHKNRRPPYANVIWQHGMLYASYRGAGASASPCAVLLNPDFSLNRILLNREILQNKMQVNNVIPCPADSHLAAFLTCRDGASRMTVVIRDIDKEETLAELDGTFSFIWSSDGKYIYSCTTSQREDSTAANSLIRWNRETGEIETVYSWPHNSIFFRLAAGPHGKVFVHVCINYHDVVMICVDENKNAVQVLQDETSAKEYLGSIRNRHYFKTDAGAPLGKIICVDEDNMRFSEPRNILSDEKFIIEGAAVEGEHLIIVYLKDAVSSMKLYDKDGKFIKEIQLPDTMGSLTLHTGSSSGHRYMSFQSFTYPPSILRYDTDTQEAVKVYSESDKVHNDILTERKFIKARDGQRIMAFLVYKKGTPKDGKRPTLMYGYGGYSSNQLPWYNIRCLGMDVCDWIEEGGIYVHCILRGGAEYGEKWHKAGSGLNKKKAFYDFIDITNAIIEDGWTTPEKIAICGSSNGGLLATALTTMAPYLWKCVIASVPHTDMLHFALDGRGSMYVTEYGDPRTEEYFEYMKSYSPYHNIKKGVKYPYIYIQTGEQDNNVPPYHGKKFAAAVQQATAGGTALLRVLPYGSHDRGSGEYFYKTTAEMQTFIEYALGMNL